MVDVIYASADGAGPRAFSLAMSSGACVGDVVRALSGRDGPALRLLVDGRSYAATTAAKDVAICRGSTLAIAAAGAPLVEDPEVVFAAPVVEVRVTGGLDAGQRFALPAGRFVIGREGCAGVDVGLRSDTVSAQHAALVVDASGVCRVEDLDSRNGVRVERAFVTTSTPLAPGALVQLGAMQLVVAPITRGDRPRLRPVGATGVIAFDRMPRTGVTTDRTLLKPPLTVAESTYGARLSWATILAPLAIGGVLLVVMPGNSMFLIIMAMSPLLAVATWAEDRRRGRRQSAAGSVQHRKAVAAFDTAVQEARRGELARRRTSSPDLAETVRRAGTPSALLWQRRPAHQDFGSLRAGTADLPWAPQLEDHGEHGAEVAGVLAAASLLELAPLELSLVAGRCLGIVAPRTQALALARALLVQAAVHHGPADLAMLVLTEPDRVPDWAWTRWLPHLRTPAGTMLLAGTVQERQSLASGLLRTDPAAPATGQLHLAVLDADGITAGRNCAPRDMLRAAAVPLAAIVLADRIDQLPGACTDIVEITHQDGGGRYTETSVGQVVDDVLVAGLSAQSAGAVAAALARYEDADLVEPGAGLPTSVPLPSLFGADGLTVAALERRWSERRTGSLTAPIGAIAGGRLVIDLVGDGPHGLIAGTTGAGKSELLRTVVASLAAAHSPRDVTFVLIDYKGGSAFAECARLPHTVGLVTDLDEHLGSRALMCLEAELRHRERLLRAAEVNDLFDYIAAGEPCGSLPRLVVAIDEFATLAAELPDFIDALVGVAQRGRSLGVHLLLATQRPRGAVKDNIRANSNLRIALRVHDAADSEDVLDAKDAAAIGRQHPGRAYLRLGPGELVAFQSAYVSGTSMSRPTDLASVKVEPVVFGPHSQQRAAPDDPATDMDEGPSDLARLVDAAAVAAALMKLDRPRQPWPEPLPTRLLLEELADPTEPSAGWCAPIGLADEPAQQRQIPYLWSSAEGGLLLFGVAGSGTSTALATIALSLARRYRPGELHLYVLDFGTQLLAPLIGLPHVGAVLAPTERERQERLIRRLRIEVARRQDVLRTTGAPGIGVHNAAQSPDDRLPAIVLMLDNWSAFAAAFEDLPGLALRDELVRVVADGPGLGIFTMITADRATAIPSAIAGLFATRLVFRLSDPHDFGTFGVAVKDLPEFVPGRAIDAGTQREVQLALPGADGIAAHVGMVTASSALQNDPADHADLPAPVLTLPEDVPLGDVGAARINDAQWWLPFGIGNNGLAPVGLRLGEGDHVLIAGPARAGKSTLLQVLADVAAAADAALRTIVIASARSPLSTLAGAQLFAIGDEVNAVQAACADDSPCLVVIDDAERVDDDLGAIRGLLAQRRPGDRVIAAGRADALRASYGHWSQELRRSRQGVVLKPNPDVDGDLWGMLLPRRGPSRFAPGRGYLVFDGEAELVQVARP